MTPPAEPRPTSGVTDIHVPAVPMSRNVTDAKHWRVRARQRSTWHDDLVWMLRSSPLPKRLLRVHAWAKLSFPQERRRDEGNYRYALEKALGDALQTAGYLPDDTPEHFTFGAITFRRAPGKATTTITIAWEVSP